MRKAFTLIELVVAVAILAIVISFSTVVFKVSIKAQRIASANMEIMQKMRAITDQLNADFGGVISEPKGKIRFGFDQSSGSEGTIDVRSDSIVFFASGDFQSTGQYQYNEPSGPKIKTAIGTAACIYYGLADVEGYSDTEKLDPKKKVLVRRQTIITGDDKWDNDYQLTDLEEYCEESLAELIVDTSFDANELMEKEELTLDDANDLAMYMYMARGVDDFTIQYVGDEVPSEDMDFNRWRPTDEKASGWSNKKLMPAALKFSFTIYDSRGIIEKGRRFTHIVYLGD